MYPSEARDLAGSVAIYMIAILFGLALFVVPIYWLSRPTVVENAGAPVQSVDRALTARSGKERFPVANLKPQTIVSPSTIAELNAKAKETEERPRSSRRVYARPQPSRASNNTAPAPHRAVYPNFSTLQ